MVFKNIMEKIAGTLTSGKAINIVMLAGLPGIDPIFGCAIQVSEKVAQGIAARAVEPEELFAPETIDWMAQAA